jgi:hypothetical protein
MGVLGLKLVCPKIPRDRHCVTENIGGTWGKDNKDVFYE